MAMTGLNVPDFLGSGPSSAGTRVMWPLAESVSASYQVMISHGNMFIIEHTFVFLRVECAI